MAMHLGIPAALSQIAHLQDLKDVLPDLRCFAVGVDFHGLTRKEQNQTHIFIESNVVFLECEHTGKAAATAPA